MNRRDRFGSIFESSYKPLQAYVRRRAKPDAADDIVADVFVVAWRRLDDIPAGKELPWLYGVARRTLANQRRGVARYRRLQERLAAEPAAPRPTANNEVLAALDRLPPAEREILRLAAWEELTPAEIAVVLDCSTNAASLRLSRARQRLRELLTGNEPPRTQTPTEASDA